MQTEKWKRMKWNERDLGDYYEVSNTGKVRNIKTGNIMKPSNVGNYGYKGVTVHIPALGIVNQKPRLHVIIAETFLGSKPFPNAQVNHKDGNKENNDASNLEWSTPKGNMKHAQENELMDENAKCKAIYRIKKDENGNIIEKKWFPSIYDAAQKTWEKENPQIKSKNIRRCINRKTYYSGGYYWEPTDDSNPNC